MSAVSAEQRSEADTRKKVRTTDVLSRKHGEKIVTVTAYDYSMAKLVDSAGVDVILVGDSLGNVVLGYPDTTRVTLDDMVHHTAAVVRASPKALVVADLPFLAAGVATRDTIRNAGRLVREAGAEAVLPLARTSDGRLGVARETGRPMVVTVNVTTPDVEGFRKSEAQVTAMLARAVGRGRRGL